MNEIYRYLIPINSTAGKVTSKGDHWEFKTEQNNLEWDICPPLLSLKDYPNTVNIIGRVSDRITIIGLYEKVKRGDAAGNKWIGRCCCGKFVVKRSKHFNQGVKKGHRNCCLQCDRVDRFRKNIKRNK